MSSGTRDPGVTYLGFRRDVSLGSLPYPNVGARPVTHGTSGELAGTTTLRGSLTVPGPPKDGSWTVGRTLSPSRRRGWREGVAVVESREGPRGRSPTKTGEGSPPECRWVVPPW